MHTHQPLHVIDWLRLAGLVFLMLAALLAILSLFLLSGNRPLEIPVYSDLSNSSHVISRLLS